MKRYNVLTNADFDNFDYINVMAYDNAGPWQPNVIRQHSSFDLAEKSIEFWVNTCNIPRSRINLGIPFMAMILLKTSSGKDLCFNYKRGS